MADFLNQTTEKRRDHQPFVFALDKEKHLQRMVPSQAMVALTADRMHLWRTLQELEGIRNPFVEAAEMKVSAQLSQEKDKALSELKAELEAKIAQRGQEAVSTAMKNLARSLTGLSGNGGSLVRAAAAGAPEAKAATSAPTQTAAQPTAQSAPPEEADEPQATVSEQPWIDERLCTTCDECIDINKKMFAYNDKKKAYIKDAKAGPFKDIVKAAEKCSSGAIHPGMPLNPNEKDLNKLIKRAEPFQ